MMTETTQGILLTYLFDNFEVGNRTENNQLKNASRKKMMAVINRDMVDIEELKLDIFADYQRAYDELSHLTDEAYEQEREEILGWEPTEEIIF